VEDRFSYDTDRRRDGRFVALKEVRRPSGKLSQSGCTGPTVRQPLERAAAKHGQSVADFVESSVVLALAEAGLLPLTGPHENGFSAETRVGHSPRHPSITV
jgi:hypothetical protein